MDMMFWVCVPVYNVEKYVGQCIESVLSQNYNCFNIILVDDGSPDKSGEICDNYAKEDTRIKVIHKKNQGLISARRTAINYVKNLYDSDKDFFIFLDSDDTLKSDALAVINNAINENNCDMVIYGIERFSDNGRVEAFEKNIFEGVVTDKHQLFKRVFLNMSYNPLCRKAVKCSLMSTKDYSDYYHISRAEDLLQDIEIYDNARKVVFIRNILYNYRNNESSITHSISARTYKIDTTVRQQVQKFLDNNSSWSEKDNIALKKYCQKMLKTEIMMVALFNDNITDKIKIFEKIRMDEFNNYLLSDKNADKILRWVELRKYRRIVFYTIIRNILSRIYHCVRGVKV